MKTILIVAQSLDGYIAHNSSELTLWTSKEDKEIFKEVTKNAGAMVMGRKTFDTFRKPLPGRLHVVMTSTPEKFDCNSKTNHENVVYTKENPQEILKFIEKKGFKTCCITGGSQIYSLFLNHNLVDEIMITIEPVIFSRGIKLVTLMGEDINLKLIESKKINENSIVLRYLVS